MIGNAGLGVRDTSHFAGEPIKYLVRTGMMDRERKKRLI